jgi:hypothetical protein
MRVISTVKAKRSVGVMLAKEWWLSSLDVDRLYPFTDLDAALLPSSEESGAWTCGERVW